MIFKLDQSDTLNLKEAELVTQDSILTKLAEVQVLVSSGDCLLLI